MSIVFEKKTYKKITDVLKYSVKLLSSTPVKLLKRQESKSFKYTATDSLSRFCQNLIIYIWNFAPFLKLCPSDLSTIHINFLSTEEIHSETYF